MNLEQLFSTAVDKKASDLHLIVGLKPYLRIDGQLAIIDSEPQVTPAKAKEWIFALLDVEQKERFEKERDLDFSHEIKDGSRFRVNVHYERGNVGLVARTIPIVVPSMEDLLMPPIVYDIVREPQGLILLTGPTGSGKSTSLAAMLDLINKERAAHIITLEDPIEYLHKSAKSIIIQRELGEDMINFTEGLKHALRQDPNVIMVGEMRDLDTIATALTLAETGHLVLATLHTHDASQTIDRIVDVFPPHQQNQIRLQLSLTLKAVISQHLLPSLQGGRVAVREVMLNSPAIANIIRENKVAQLKTAIQTSADKGMFTMEQDLKRLLKEGVISEESSEMYLRYMPYKD